MQSIHRFFIFSFIPYQVSASLHEYIIWVEHHPILYVCRLENLEITNDKKVTYFCASIIGKRATISSQYISRRSNAALVFSSLTTCSTCDEAMAKEIVNTYRNIISSCTKITAWIKSNDKSTKMSLVWFATRFRHQKMHTLM